MEIVFEQLGDKISHLRNNGKRIAFCHGCFDGLHDGHLNLFKKGKEISDILLIGIESDEYIKENKGGSKPKYPAKERIRNITATNLVDFVFLIPYSDNSIYQRLYQTIRPHFLITATDEILSKKRRDAEKFNIQVITIEKHQ